SRTPGIVETAIAHLSFQRGQSRSLPKTRLSRGRRVRETCAPRWSLACRRYRRVADLRDPERSQVVTPEDSAASCSAMLAPTQVLSMLKSTPIILPWLIRTRLFTSVGSRSLSGHTNIIRISAFDL